MTIKKVRIITEDKKYVPEAKTELSAGNDLVATSMDFDPINRCWVYGTGLKLEIPKGYFGDIRARSSIYKQGPYVLANGAGVLDADYQEELKVVFRCTDPEWGCVEDPPYLLGDRIAQLVLVPYATVEFEKVKTFERKATRKGGFGSTGGRKKTKAGD